MKPHIILWDKLLEIRSSLTNQEFNNIAETYCKITNKSLNFKYYEDKLQKVKDVATDESSVCSCNENQICMKKDLKLLKKCKNYAYFLKLNPHIAYISLQPLTKRKINFTEMPIVFPNVSLKEMQKNIKNLRSLFEIQVRHEIFDYIDILLLALNDYIMRHLVYIKVHRQEGLIELIRIENYLNFSNRLFDLNNFNPEVWIRFYESHICNSPEQIIEMKYKYRMINDIVKKFGTEGLKLMMTLVELVPMKNILKAICIMEEGGSKEEYYAALEEGLDLETIKVDECESQDELE